MIVTQAKAVEIMNGFLPKLLFDKEKQNKIIEVAEGFGMPSGDAMDYIAGRRLLTHADTFRLFILSKGMDAVFAEDITSKIFTENEQREYSKQKIEPDHIKLPIQIKAVQIADDQWIGSCDMKFMMRLYNSQMIKYNANAQRVMQRLTRKNTTFYRIAINQKAVSEIALLIRNGSFIPNTITLNLPEDAEWSYDKESCILTVRKIDMFDISDGYHRLLAMSRVYSEDKDINIPLELRITTFNEEKTRQFIYQEDQKTKMRRVDSDSMNVYDPCNKIVERLNMDMNFVGQSMIARNEGQISFGELSKVIRYYYPPKRNASRKEVVQYATQTEKKVCQILNSAIEDNLELLDGRITIQMLMVIFYCANNFDTSDEVRQHIKNGFDRISEVKAASSLRTIEKKVKNVV